MSKYILRSLLCLLLSQLVNDAHAQLLRSDKGNIPLARNSVHEYLQQIQPDHNSSGRSYVLLSFDSLLTTTQRNDITAAGITLKDWYPGNHYLARVTNWEQSLERLALLSALGQIPLAGVNNLPVIVKTSLLRTGPANKGGGTADVAVSVYEPQDLGLLRTYLDQAGISYRQERYCGANTLVIPPLSQTQTEALAALSYVASVADYSGDPEPEWSYKMQTNQVYTLNYNFQTGASGKGVYFGNYEIFGVDTIYDFNQKGRQHPLYYGTGDDGHGTSVAAILGAADNYDEFEHRGMAPGITSLYVGWYNTAETRYTTDGLRPMVSNHSVGWGPGNVRYDNNARELDRITRSLVGYLHGYSAGNSGGSGPYLGYAAGWANLTGNIKTNKNNFTVHSAANPGFHHDWTNKGPTADGRLKPDICAEGGEGSSYAAPGVMGLAALLYEVYQQTYSVTTPRSDVVKAVMLNTAYDIDKKGIDFKTGFGTINPIRAERAIKGRQLRTGTMPMGSSGRFTDTITIPPATSEARFLLYWHDYPGATGAAKALVNDLDLFVTSPSGDTIRPWVLNPSPATVYDLPQRKTDTLNNVEQVTIDSPVAGNYIVHVSGTAVPQGPQDFAFTYDLQAYHIELTNPAAGYRIPRGKKLMITWNFSNVRAVAADSLELYLQQDNGKAFVRLATLAYDRRYFEYTIPATFPYSATARIAIRQRNHSLGDTSDYFQVMATPANLRMTRMCPDTIGLSWDTLTGNTSGTYIIYRLGEKYMAPVDSVLHPANSIKLAATVISGSSSWNGPQYFAVAARHASGALSIRSLPVSTIIDDPINARPVITNYNLCIRDTVFLSAGKLAYDSIQWYRKGDSTVILARSDSFRRNCLDTGYFCFKSYAKGCTYTSPAYRINRNSADIADTAAWGNFKWLISCYNGYKTASPYYGPEPNYYGQFPIDSQSFNSSDYFAWYSTGPHNAPAYQGCSFRSASNTSTVYKRRGFKPGRYQINLLRASGRMKMTVDTGSISTYTSPTDASSIDNIWNGNLDSSSAIRIETYGSHLNLQLVPENTSLAVSLIRFDAQALNRDVLLSFSFQSTHTPLAEIRHSTDGRHFDRTAGRIRLLQGRHDYRFTDEAAVSGRNYYRLFWTTEDNKPQYSQVVQVMRQAGGRIELQPTLTADGRITVRSEGIREPAILVTDLLGRRMEVPVSGNKELKIISLAGLAPGRYLVRVGSAEQQEVFSVTYQP